jgi:hypothetical protein
MSAWKDCGHQNPTSNYVSNSMTVYKGHVYAGTSEGRANPNGAMYIFMRGISGRRTAAAFVMAGRQVWGRSSFTMASFMPRHAPTIGLASRVVSMIQDASTVTWVARNGRFVVSPTTMARLITSRVPEGSYMVATRRIPDTPLRVSRSVGHELWRLVDSSRAWFNRS